MQSAQRVEINAHKRIRTGMHKHTYMQSAKGGEINPMVAGHKMTAIFGFAILNHFNDITDALQEV